ncbi:MAG: ribonuclease domain-containing protein [Sciscionella sp.]
MSSRGSVTTALVALVVLVFVGWGVKSWSSEEHAGGATPGAGSGLPVKALSALPHQATTTWKLIESDGPFPYQDNDGSVFGNFEHLLPREKRGYYHEYTVPTPESHTRGARRLITGSSHELYYTGDHYSSFVVVDTGR